MPSILKLSEPPFTSIQGEGVRSGLPTTFIRTFGCGLHCPWCDTKYSWQDNGNVLERTPQDLAEELDLNDHDDTNRLFEITGGEPLEQKEAVFELASLIRDAGHRVALQTNGVRTLTKMQRTLFNYVSVDLKKEFDWKWLKVLNVDDEIKIIANMSDLNMTHDVRQVVTQVHESTMGYVNIVIIPMTKDSDERLAHLRDTELLVAQLKKLMRRFPEVRIMPRLQYLLWGTKRGV
jgi:7-carboxy-7-deazaguanine synthase